MTLEDIIFEEKQAFSDAKFQFIGALIFWLMSIFSLPFLFFNIFLLFFNVIFIVIMSFVALATKAKYDDAKEIYKYYSSQDFADLRNSLKENCIKCNELNNYIEELKSRNVLVKTKIYGEAEFHDDSSYKFKRPEHAKLINNINIINTINCSAAICKNAKLQPFKYVCKYFDMPINDDTLTKIETLFNNFTSIKEGENLLLKERKELFNEILKKIPNTVVRNNKEKLINRLGFDDVHFNKMYIPEYNFLYVSPGGNSSIKTTVKFNTKNLSDFICYLSEIIELRKSAKYQRVLMTSNLREEIKKRDNYTCQQCGLSIYDEPNLLLEIDHIIPVSKGGLTTKENLQTLCWKCNRKKGNKL